MPQIAIWIYGLTFALWVALLITNKSELSEKYNVYTLGFHKLQKKTP